MMGCDGGEVRSSREWSRVLGLASLRGVTGWRKVCQALLVSCHERKCWLRMFFIVLLLLIYPVFIFFLCENKLFLLLIYAQSSCILLLLFMCSIFFLYKYSFFSYPRDCRAGVGLVPDNIVVKILISRKSLNIWCHFIDCELGYYICHFLIVVDSRDFIFLWDSLTFQNKLKKKNVHV